MVAALGSVIVLAAALYLLALGICALVRPDRTRRFLQSFASSARIHFTELALRLLVGGALVVSAPRMLLSRVVALFGWVLIGTTLVLAVVPWRLHRRFAAWSVPQATRRIPVFGAGSIVAGLLLLGALALGRSAG